MKNSNMKSRPRFPTCRTERNIHALYEQRWLWPFLLLHLQYLWSVSYIAHRKLLWSSPHHTTWTWSCFVIVLRTQYKQIPVFPPSVHHLLKVYTAFTDDLIGHQRQVSLKMPQTTTCEAAKQFMLHQIFCEKNLPLCCPPSWMDDNLDRKLLHLRKYENRLILW